MEILTLELFEVTVSEALREVGRALEEHPDRPLRILLGHDRMLQHNVQRLLDRLGRQTQARQDGPVWRLDVTPPGKGAAPALPRAQVQAAPAQAPAPAPPPLLITRSRLGSPSQDAGRRLLLGLLQELDPAVPWVCLALGALELLEDPQALAALEQLQARGVPVRVSRESQLFALEPLPFEVMEDSHWLRLAGRGALTIL
jgi:hypothetical protein